MTTAVCCPVGSNPMAPPHCKTCDKHHQADLIHAFDCPICKRLRLRGKQSSVLCSHQCITVVDGKRCMGRQEMKRGRVQSQWCEKHTREFDRSRQAVSR